jgi:hypothetical protein
MSGQPTNYGNYPPPAASPYNTNFPTQTNQITYGPPADPPPPAGHQQPHHQHHQHNQNTGTAQRQQQYFIPNSFYSPPTDVPPPEGSLPAQNFPPPPIPPPHLASYANSGAGLYAPPQNFGQSGRTSGLPGPSSSAATLNGGTIPPVRISSPQPDRISVNYGNAGAPQLQQIVRRVQKEVQLTDTGNFVIDVPVSKKLLEGVPYTTGEEFTHLR